MLIDNRAGLIRRAQYAQDLSRLKQPVSETMGSHQAQGFCAKSHHSEQCTPMSHSSPKSPNIQPLIKN
ncbi:hypothetical protein [Pseudomonas sp. NBRC 111137]|uniref:hypothetical protein n=1 Tax=Pseudomonas sp. NBRC 111137 TaxID=1661052 RepID=UPI0012E307AE|nr:hypothetical protein [Pseudomonas sp. NBRC 111137]